MIINTGIMLERLTNGRIPIGWHRVVAAPGYEGERYSVVQFCHPRPWTILSPVPSCCTPETPQRFHALSAADALDEVLYQINLVEDARRVCHRSRPEYLDEPTEQLEPPRQLAPAILAIDVGGTRFEAGLVTAKGELVDRSLTTVEQDVGPEAHFANLADHRRAADGARRSPRPPRRRRRRRLRRSDHGQLRDGVARQRLRVARVPAPRTAARADRQARLRRSRRQGAGPRRGLDGRGQGPRQLLRDHRVDRNRRRHRPRRRAARRGVDERRPRRPPHRRPQRTAVQLWCARLPRGRGVRPGHRGDHRTIADGADVRDHATHRTPGRPGGGVAVQPPRPRSRRRRRRRRPRLRGDVLQRRPGGAQHVRTLAVQSAGEDHADAARRPGTADRGGRGRDQGLVAGPEPGRHERERRRHDEDPQHRRQSDPGPAGPGGRRGLLVPRPGWRREGCRFPAAEPVAVGSSA